MKLFVLCIGLIGLGISISCDKVSNPIPDMVALNVNCDTVINITETPSALRNVLIEDFSGHKCPNCPDAAAEANAIHANVGNRVITVTIHPDPNIMTSFTSLVKESPAGSGSYETVWYIPAGGEIMNFFGDPGYIPVGMINRVNNGANTYKYFDFNVWNTAVTAELTKPLEISLVNKVTELTDGTICGQARAEFLSTLTGDYRMVHYLVEDSISDYQLDGSTTLPNYTHRHVLRSVAGGTIWGSIIATGTSVAGTVYEEFFSFDTGSFDVVDPNNLIVISYVYDDVTKEIMQVVETHLH